MKYLENNTIRKHEKHRDHTLEGIFVVFHPTLIEKSVAIVYFFTLMVSAKHIYPLGVFNFQSKQKQNHFSTTSPKN